MYPAAFLRFDFAIAGLPACCCLRFHMVSRCGVLSTSNLVEQIIPLKLPITNIFKYDVLQWNTVFWNEIRSFGVKYKVLEWSSTPNFQSGWKDANPVKIINHMSAWFCVIVREVCVKYHVFAWNTKFLRDLGPLEISRISAQKVIALGVQKLSNVQIWWHVVNSSQIRRNFTDLSNQNCGEFHFPLGP